MQQDDRYLSRLALQQAIKENGTAFKAGYAYVAGFAPLDRRDETWREVKAANPGIVERVRIGVVNDTTALSTADQAKAALRAHPEITVFFAFWDEAARGVKLALDELGLADVVQPTLLTQADLRKDNIHTMAQLSAKIPAFGHSSAATASWIPGQ